MAMAGGTSWSAFWSCSRTPSTGTSGRRCLPLPVIVLFGNTAPGPAELFRRGDVDGDGAVELPDAIAILDRLFLGGEPPGCPDAADANDDGELDLSDPITILSRLFLGGEPLPPPGPIDCGPDPTADALPACAQRC